MINIHILKTSLQTLTNLGVEWRSIRDCEFNRISFFVLRLVNRTDHKRA